MKYYLFIETNNFMYSYLTLYGYTEFRFIACFLRGGTIK